MPISTSLTHLETYKKYLQVLSATEEFLAEEGFIKLDLPVLLPCLIPESYLEVFETEYRYFDTRQKMYLTPSPELLIKRLLVEGIGSCYYLGKSFRNSEPLSSKHSGEFAMLEMYRVGVDYLGLADTVLRLLQRIASMVKSSGGETPGYQFEHQGTQVDVSRWEKLTVAQAFEKYAQISSEELFDHDKFRRVCKIKGYTTERIAHSVQGIVEESKDKSKRYPLNSAHYSYEELWSQVYANEVEPHMGMNGHPTLLYDYPVEFAALSKPNSDGRTAQRFEFYIAGVELGNCYSELTEWKLQEERLLQEDKMRTESGKISHPVDHGFVESLKKGLPECAGIAIGMERLAMIFADTQSIQDLKLISVS